MTPGARAVAAGALLLLGLGCSQEAPPAGSGRVLVTSGFTDQVFVLNAGTGEVVDSIDLDRRPGERDEPHGITTAPDLQHVYVTLSHGEPSLWKIETEGLRIVGRVTLDARGASRVRLSPDGGVAAVPDYWLSGGGEVSYVSFVGTRDLDVRESTAVCPAPHDAAFSPSGAEVLVACPLTDEWVVLSGSDYSVRERIPLESPDANAVPARPLNVVWWSESVAFASVHRGGGTWRIDRDRGEAAPAMPGEGAAQLAVSPDGRTLVTAHRTDGTVGILDLSDTGHGTRVRTVALEGPHPHGVAFGPNSDVVFVTWEGDTGSPGGVAAIDVIDGQTLWSRQIGVYTLGITWAPDAKPR